MCLKIANTKIKYEKIHVKCFKCLGSRYKPDHFHCTEFNNAIFIILAFTRIRLCNLQHGNFNGKAMLVDHGHRIWFLSLPAIETLYMYFIV